VSAVALALLTALQSPADGIDCENAMSQMEMTACAARRFEQADAELNRLWRTTIADAGRFDRSADNGQSPRDRRSEEALLRRTQRAWIAFRDGQCEIEGMAERGGSLEPMIVNECLARLTRERIAQLNRPDEQ
jgi:uncharacterized protein YecT (DUF1311 family)